MTSRSTHAVRLALALTLVAAGSLAAAPARAWYRPDAPLWAQGRIVDVQVRVDGRAAPLYLSPQGDSRRYLQAFAGRNYSLVLRNESAERIGVLIAVDGLNVVNGQRSSLQSTEPMYVLGPWETATIDGWRTSLDDVQRFVFVDEARSYAARTGQANGDMGWIRVLAFREQSHAYWPPRAPRWYEGPHSNYRDERGGNVPREPLPAPGDAPMAAAPAPTRAQGEVAPQAAAPEAKARSYTGTQDDPLSRRDDGGSFPGTGWGRHQSDHVEQVRFDAERLATDTIVFRYEYASGLRALGIVPDRDRLRERDNGELGFAKPPRW